MTTRIMVVDDDPLIRQLLIYQLSGVGYDVSTAQNGREALENLATNQPDLVLLDVMMPDMSGWDVCDQIRDGNASTVPIIMLTSKGAENDVITGLKSGADDYVTKPYRLNQLLARIEAVLRRARRLESPHIRAGGGVTSTTTSGRQQPGTAYPAQPGLKPVLPRPSVAVEPVPAEAQSRSGLGQRLTEARRMRGQTLYQAEMACGIRWEFLQALEYEHFNYIPRTQLRSVLHAYATYLGIDLHDYVKARPEQLAQKKHHPLVFSTGKSVPVVLVSTAAVLVLMLVLVLGWHFF